MGLERTLYEPELEDKLVRSAVRDMLRSDDGYAANAMAWQIDELKLHNDRLAHKPRSELKRIVKSYIIHNPQEFGYAQVAPADLPD